LIIFTIWSLNSVSNDLRILLINFSSMGE